MKILKVYVDALPECCADCLFIALRTNRKAWPHCCGLNDFDILETEGKRPDGCPLYIEESEE